MNNEKFVGIVFLVAAFTSTIVFLVGLYENQLTACAIVVAAWIYALAHS